jgi:ribulose-phosphate 3-epimerase
MKKPFLLAPSILGADFANLERSLGILAERGGDFVHIDVMDGHFVPNLTIGAPVVKAIRKHSSLPFDVHLMVSNPEALIPDFVAAGADYITFHIEASVHAYRLVSVIHESGKKAGISIVPSTPVSAIRELLPVVDMVLVMTVNPGFGGQEMIPACLEKVRELKKIQRECDFSYIVSVDGGVNSGTIRQVLDAGTDVIVSGSAFFSGELDAVLRRE